MQQSDHRYHFNEAYREEMARDPNRVIQDLKMTLEMVRGSRELNADVRNQLIGVLQAALHAAGRYDACV